MGLNGPCRNSSQDKGLDCRKCWGERLDRKSFRCRMGGEMPKDKGFPDPCPSMEACHPIGTSAEVGKSLLLLGIQEASLFVVETGSGADRSFTPKGFHLPLPSAHHFEALLLETAELQGRVTIAL